nr:hypothetical protein [Pseudomonadota bacterium]
VLALPEALRRPLRELLETAELPARLTAEFAEDVSGFLNPNQPVGEQDWRRWLARDAAALRAYFGRPADAVIKQTLERLGYAGDGVVLRQLHEAAGVAALTHAPAGKLTPLLLEGNPGIGKTTSLIKTLKGFMDDWLMIYASPRIVINNDVTEKLIWRGDGPDSGRLANAVAITTNARLIAAARHVYNVQRQDNLDRFVDGAVIAEGDPALVAPHIGVLCLSAEAAHALEGRSESPGLRSRAVSERKVKARDAVNDSVVKTAAVAAGGYLKCNPALNRVLITFAIQSHVTLPGKDSASTIDCLNHLFDNTKPYTAKGFRRRRELAQRIRNVVVMVDEIAGDACGCAFVHAITAWLEENFLHPFAEAGEASPFRVLLILADASLGQELILSRYLEGDSEAPGKVLVSAADGAQPLRMTVHPVGLGPGRKKRDGLHVMTNSFPAARLTLAHRLTLERLSGEEFDPHLARKPEPSQIRALRGEELLDNAVREIRRALEEVGPERQVLFFAQDKAFLEEVRNALLDGGDGGLTRDQIRVLHGKTPPQERKALLRPEVRDRLRLVLMTSSGSRGISFPLATHLLALMPRFAPESALMEIVQFIYRGRGMYRDPATGRARSGDGFDRKIVMLINDFLVVPEGRVDPELWLRKVIDWLTAMILLRGSVYTRIRGDAALPGRPLALVPVGPVSDRSLETSLSGRLRAFIVETEVLKRRHADDRQLSGALVRAAEWVRALFPRLRWNAGFAQAGILDLNAPASLLAFIRQVAPASGPLLNLKALPMVPAGHYCIGPLWLQDQGSAGGEEAFSVATWDPRTEAQRRRLLGLLRGLVQDPRCRDLRPGAFAVIEMLRHEVNDAGKASAYQIGKDIRARRKWLAVPIDYPLFGYEMDAGLRLVAKPYEEHDAWLDALRRTLTLNFQGEVLPVIPLYEEKPFIVLLGTGDVTGLRHLFDPRRFMATTELNVLNTLLFARQG